MFENTKNFCMGHYLFCCWNFKLRYPRWYIRKLCSLPESEVEVTRFLSAIAIDIKTKQTISIKFEECAAILDIQNDVSVVIQQITSTENLNMQKPDIENNYNFAWNVSGNKYEISNLVPGINFIWCSRGT